MSYDNTQPLPRRQARQVHQEQIIETVHDPLTPETARDVYQAETVGPGGASVVRSEQVHVPSPALRKQASVSRAKQGVMFVIGIINVLLAIRFVLLLFGANQGAPFVDLIYSITGIFVMPFQGIFGEPVYGQSIIEWSSLIAIAIYTLLGYGITRLIQLSMGPSRAEV